MIYYSKDGRDVALKNIKELYVKFANLAPTNKLSLEDIRDTMYYLRTLESAIKSEQHSEDKKKRQRTNAE